MVVVVVVVVVVMVVVVMVRGDGRRGVLGQNFMATILMVTKGAFF